MNVNSVKIAEKRFESPSISNLGIQAWGANNLYPQEITNIIACSDSASSCIGRYISFIQGNGFKDIAFSETVLNRLNETADDLIQLISNDVANFYGLSIHVNYNVFGEISEIFHVPFENCRLCEENTDGIVTKIAVHPDWTGRLKRNGRLIRVSKENIDYINIFNPDKNIVQRQIELAGGIENYKGQILWVSNKGKQTYSLPKYDSVISQMSTEEGVGNIDYRNARCGFQPAAILITRKGQNTVTELDEGVRSSIDVGFEIQKRLSELQSDINTSKILHYEIENEEEEPKFIKMQSQNYDKEYTVTSEKCESKIYSAFGQEIFYRLKNGSIGFSSDMITQAYEYYSTITNNERRMIERSFDKIFKYFKPSAMQTSNFEIQPLKYEAKDSNNNTNAVNIA